MFIGVLKLCAQAGLVNVGLIAIDGSKLSANASQESSYEYERIVRELLAEADRVELGDGVPDGICADPENAVRYADVPNRRCVRVREGGEVLQTIELDRGCFACALGGPDGKTLFMVAQEWNGPAGMFQGPRTGQVLMAPAPAPAGGRP